jgi:hypothetical protein
MVPKQRHCSPVTQKMLLSAPVRDDEARAITGLTYCRKTTCRIAAVSALIGRVLAPG